MDSVILDAACRYSESTQKAKDLEISAEPEAQLTNPIDNLFTTLASRAGVGDLHMIREAQLDGLRPDFAATIDGFACGWVELKRPGHTLQGAEWKGREKDQWSLLAELDSLIVTDGRYAVLYNEGIPVGDDPVELPMDSPETWDPAPLESMLHLFSTARPATIKRVSQLARKLAPLARLLRLRLQEGIDNDKPGFKPGKTAWDQAMQRKTTEASFASDVAQVLAYSMAIAGLEGGADRNKDGILTVEEASDKLHKGPHNVLAAALGPVLGIPDLMRFIQAEVGGIERIVSAIDIKAIHKHHDARGEPWLWFYEDFLAHYDPGSRNKSGVYYTPAPVVQCQVRLVDHILRKKLDRNLGFGAPSVTTLDPAAGSGTYPLAVIDYAEKAAVERRGRGGRVQAGKNLRKNLVAFELLPGPYAVAQLRIGQRLSEVLDQYSEVTAEHDDLQVYLTDTLEGPSVGNAQSGLFGDALVLSEQAAKARALKHGRQVTVVIGNPPYARVTGEEGGWVTNPDSGRRLFDDVIKPAQDAGIIFSAQASLYDLYVYFWRWALWKAFEEHPEEAAVVSFITASNWLKGPAFVGLRNLARALGSEVWVIDLGGDGRGSRQEENVFDIQSPVAIVTIWSDRASERSSQPAKVYYRKVEGNRREKFESLDRIGPPSDDKGSWQLIPAAEGNPLAPTTSTGSWAAYPKLTDIFPWQGPGCKWNRMWTVAPSKSVLERRWKALLEEEQAVVRAERFVTPSTGRNIHTSVNGMPPIASLGSDAPHQPIVRYAWRSFDRQWVFEDPRLAALERPALWRSRSQKQIFLVSLNTSPMGRGPALAASTDIPDLHYFRGSYGGKDVMPLYRDAAASLPNLPAGFLEVLSTVYGRRVTPEDLAAYVSAVLAHDGYTERFSAELGNPGARVPITRDPEVFQRAVAIGESLLWLQTYGQRFVSNERPHGEVPLVEGIEWREAVSRIPATPKGVTYDPTANELHIADGVVTGVTLGMREFNISGMNVLDRWLGSRTSTGIGRASTTSSRATYLDRIRPTEWEDEWNDELLDLLRVLKLSLDKSDQQAGLLEEIISGDLVRPEELPTPTEMERKAPGA